MDNSLWDSVEFPDERLDDSDSIIIQEPEWQDEFLQEAKKNYFKEYERFQPPEAEVFLSVLDMYRRKGREDVVNQVAKGSAGRPRVPAVCLPKDPRTKKAKPREEDFDKQRSSAKKAYEDYVKYKRHEQNKERIQEFMSLGILDEKLHHSFDMGEGAEKDTHVQERLHGSAADADQLEIDLNKIIKHSPIFKDVDVLCPPPVEPNQPKHSEAITSIIEDRYYPGLLDDAINRKIDFYQMSFNASFGRNVEPPAQMPMEAPLSLVEAFDLRAISEEEQLKKMVATSTPKKGKKPVTTETEMTGKSFITFFKDAERKGRELVREEEALAQTVELDLAAMARDSPLNEIGAAIQCLRRAEIMNEFDKSLQAAEDAYLHAPPELKESAAVHKATTFVTEQLSKKTTSVGSGGTYNPIEVVSYIGITKPAQKYDSDEEEPPKKPQRTAVPRKGGAPRQK